MTPIEHQGAQSRFVAATPAGLAVLDYEIVGQRLIALHTGVPEALRGQGMAARLTEALVAYCRAQGLKLVPRCSYTAAWVQRHPQDVEGLLDS